MLVSQIGGWTADMWGTLIGLFNFIPNWGWMILLFTVCLKLILSPLDFWQKKIARESAKKQAVLQPELAKIQQKFANNKQIVNQKTMELYKRENFSMFGSCIGMLVNMALTLFIFMTLFYALMGIGQAQSFNQYTTLQEDYNDKFSVAFNIENDSIAIQNKENDLWESALNKAEIDNPEEEDELVLYNIALQNYADTETEIEGQKVADIQAELLAIYQDEVQQNWLWVSNIWRPDTNVAAFPDYASFVSSSNLYNSEQYLTALSDKIDGLGAGATSEQKAEATKQVQSEFENKYNFITYDIQEKQQGWNGYFILVILAAVVTYLSVLVSQMSSGQKKNQAQAATPEGAVNPNKTMKFMKFLLPILMIIFTTQYSAVFAIYIVTNSVMSTILSFVVLKILNQRDQKQKITITTKSKPDYSR